jgi:hypothetical protein
LAPQHFILPSPRSPHVVPAPTAIETAGTSGQQPSLQRAHPALQVIPHTPLLHVAVPFAGAAHTVQLGPHPSARSPAQLPLAEEDASAPASSRAPVESVEGGASADEPDCDCEEEVAVQPLAHPRATTSNGQSQGKVVRVIIRFLSGEGV